MNECKANSLSSLNRAIVHCTVSFSGVPASVAPSLGNLNDSKDIPIYQTTTERFLLISYVYMHGAIHMFLLSSEVIRLNSD